MEYVCFIPIDTAEDELLAFKHLYSAYGLHVEDLDEEDAAGGFIGLALDEKEKNHLSDLSEYTLKGILMNRECTHFVIASMENELFHIVSLKDGKYTLELMKSDDFQAYFNKCIKNCETKHCNNKHYPDDDTKIIDAIWENTVNK